MHQTSQIKGLKINFIYIDTLHHADDFVLRRSVAVTLELFLAFILETMKSRNMQFTKAIKIPDFLFFLYHPINVNMQLSV